MKKYILITALSLVATVLISRPGTCSAENNSINISYEYDAGFCNDLNQFSLEYEYFFKTIRISLLGRYSNADYTIDDTSGFGRAGEDGGIEGFDFGFRFYPIGSNKMNRLFFGGAYGFFQNDWKENSFGYDQGTYTENVTRLDTEIGYRFNMASQKVFFTPSTHLGYYFRDSSTLGIYSGISISVGIAF